MRIFDKFFLKGYQVINLPDLEQLEKKYSKAWKDDSIPSRQLQLTKKQLPQIEKLPAIADLIDMVSQTKLFKPHILEVGCSTGYHIDAFKKAKLNVSYEGCDYSPAFVELAKRLHPQSRFKLDDATKLTYATNQFDIIISGCCLLHIFKYQKAIMESSRVANKFVIFHRTPVVHLTKTTYAKKVAYGVEMVEIFFNETELFQLFAKSHLVIKLVKTHGQFFVKGLPEPVFMKNYLCEKISFPRASSLPITN